MSTTSPEELKKLTVPQLKALCKEKKITGYSKLGKNAIIQKLVERNNDIGPMVPQASPNESYIQGTNPARTATLLGQQSDGHEKYATVSSTLEALSSKCCTPPSSTQCDDDSGTKPYTNVAGLLSGSRLTNHSISNIIPSDLTSNQKKFPKKRTLEPLATITSSCKKKRDLMVLPSDHTIQVPSAPQPDQPSSITQYVITTATCLEFPKPTLSNDVASGFQSPVPAQSIPKRFIPLKVNQTKPLAHHHMHPPTPNQEDPSVQYLDFIPMPTIHLQSVSFPPSLSQRKNVSSFALLLSAIATEDIYNCTRVSRLFRYAVYISAVYRLERKFPGRRLEAVIQKCSPNMTNMWPYLRQREQELLSRQKIYQGSFLAQAWKGKYKISERLWASPDNDKQITIIIRFLLTHLFFLVSVTGDRGERSKGMITDAQELIEGEIWSITICSPSSTEVLYVLEMTCEVIGRPSSFSEGMSNEQTSALPLRADWSTYVDNYPLSLPAGSQPPSLMSYLKWTNHEEYDRGISKLWLRRIDSEGELGAAKRVIAERYVLACVVANSISGRWMSSTDMVQEFNGVAVSQVSHPKQSTRVQLFLPVHHHVESVHFNTSKGDRLHPALVIVQTPTREYHVLKDNGMQVGCEEEGIGTVWMQILQCDVFGRPKIM